MLIIFLRKTPPATRNHELHSSLLLAKPDIKHRSIDPWIQHVGTLLSTGLDRRRVQLAPHLESGKRPWFALCLWQRCSRNGFAGGIMQLLVGIVMGSTPLASICLNARTLRRPWIRLVPWACVLEMLGFFSCRQLF